MRFRVGDKVRLKSYCSGIRPGKIYILKSFSGQLWAGKTRESGSGGCSCQHNWSLVKKMGEELMKFKVGNRVVLISPRKDLTDDYDAPRYGGKCGKILGTITRIRKTKTHPIEVLWDNEEANDFYPDELQFISFVGIKEVKPKIETKILLKMNRKNLLTMRGQIHNTKMFLMGGQGINIKRIIPLPTTGGCGNMPKVSSRGIANAMTTLTAMGLNALGFGLARDRSYASNDGDIRRNIHRWGFNFPNCIFILVNKRTTMCWRLANGKRKKLHLQIINRKEVNKNGKTNHSKTGSSRPKYEKPKRSRRRYSWSTA